MMLHAILAVFMFFCTVALLVAGDVAYRRGDFLRCRNMSAFSLVLVAAMLAMLAFQWP